jgi:hypothetical protein
MSADEWATSKVGVSKLGDSLLGNTPGGRQYQCVLGDRCYFNINQRYVCVNIDFQKRENGRSVRSLSITLRWFLTLCHIKNSSIFGVSKKLKKLQKARCICKLLRLKIHLWCTYLTREKFQLDFCRPVSLGNWSYSLSVALLHKSQKNCLPLGSRPLCLSPIQLLFCVDQYKSTGNYNQVFHMNVYC